MNQKVKFFLNSLIAFSFIFFLGFYLYSKYEKYRFSKDAIYFYSMILDEKSYDPKYKFYNNNPKYFLEFSKIDNLLKNKKYNEAVNSYKQILSNKSITYTIKIAASTKLAHLYLIDEVKKIPIEDFEKLIKPLLKNKFLKWHYYELMLYYKYKNNINYENEISMISDIITEDETPYEAKDRLSKACFIIQNNQSLNG